LDSDGHVIYDPFPTTGSAGFDLDAVGVRYFAASTGWMNTWFGEAYIFAEGGSWIFSSDNATFQYISPIDDASAWFYDLQMGWIYADSGSYPYLYVEALGQWVYFYYDHADADRWYCLWDESLAAALPDYPYASATQLAALER
ncbi:MAG: hypothetical protein WC360_03000, partial [Opitutales bacterium]